MTRKQDIYKQLEELFEGETIEQIVIHLCNFFNSAELCEFIVFLEEERENG